MLACGHAASRDLRCRQICTLEYAAVRRCAYASASVEGAVLTHMLITAGKLKKDSVPEL